MIHGTRNSTYQSSTTTSCLTSLKRTTRSTKVDCCSSSTAASSSQCATSISWCCFDATIPNCTIGYRHAATLPIRSLRILTASCWKSPTTRFTEPTIRRLFCSYGTASQKTSRRTCTAFCSGSPNGRRNILPTELHILLAGSINIYGL